MVELGHPALADAQLLGQCLERQMLEVVRMDEQARALRQALQRQTQPGIHQAALGVFLRRAQLCVDLCCFAVEQKGQAQPDDVVDQLIKREGTLSPTWP